MSGSRYFVLGSAGDAAAGAGALHSLATSWRTRKMADEAKGDSVSLRVRRE